MVLARLILGLLNIAPMTGYDVKRHVDSTISYFWQADKAQVYRTLSALVADGYATVQVIHQVDRPDRQEHHITEAGRGALVDWLRSDLAPHADRDPFLARLFFAGILDRDQVRGLLHERRDQSEALLSALTAMRDPAGASDPANPTADRAGYLRSATLEHGIAHVRAELNWLDTTERDLP